MSAVNSGEDENTNDKYTVTTNTMTINIIVGIIVGGCRPITAALVVVIIVCVVAKRKG